MAGKDERLNLRMTKELLDWSKEYADKKGMTLTKLITSYLEKLKAEESGKV